MEYTCNLRNVQDPLADGHGGVLKACLQLAAADPRGSRTCVCASTPGRRVAHAGEEGRINVLPWYGLVGVASTSSEVATWYGDDSPHLSWNAHQVTARLVKTVNIQV